MAKGVNPNIKFKKKEKKSVKQYVDLLHEGDRFVLSEILTLIESSNEANRQIGEEILSKIKPNPEAIRIGVSGSPGAGKSTFIEALGSKYLKMGKKVAVLAVDPSSTKSQGSILGDKTRMQGLSVHENAFVRPTPSSNILGGVAAATREAIALCEAAKYDVIIIESVGVGQSETILAGLVDIFLLLILPGSGDEVQGIKKGIVEMADIVIINKHDGDHKLAAKKSKRDFTGALSLTHHDLEGWKIPVLLVSSLEVDGFEELQNAVREYIDQSKSKGFFESKRADQNADWFQKRIHQIIYHEATNQLDMDALMKTGDGVTEAKLFSKLNETKAQIKQLIKALRKEE